MNINDVDNLIQELNNICNNMKMNVVNINENNIHNIIKKQKKINNDYNKNTHYNQNNQNSQNNEETQSESSYDASSSIINDSIRVTNVTIPSSIYNNSSSIK